MQYLILIYDSEAQWGTLSKPETEKMYAAYGAYTQELVKAGVMRGANQLQPIATATTVRLRGGKLQTTDGPFAETKEQLGGYYLIDVPNLDEAVRWAAKCPSATVGSIEVRPIVERPGM
jgi:hypothetical protein